MPAPPPSQYPVSMTGAFEPFPCWNGRKVYWALAFLRFYFALSRSGYSHPLLIKLGSHFQTLPATTSRVLTKQTANYSLSLSFSFYLFQYTNSIYWSKWAPHIAYHCHPCQHFLEVMHLNHSVGEGVKKNRFFGTLSQTSDPTHPPRTFRTPLSEK